MTCSHSHQYKWKCGSYQLTTTRLWVKPKTLHCQQQLFLKEQNNNISLSLWGPLTMASNNMLGEYVSYCHKINKKPVSVLAWLWSCSFTIKDISLHCGWCNISKRSYFWHKPVDCYQRLLIIADSTHNSVCHHRHTVTLLNLLKCLPWSE